MFEPESDATKDVLFLERLDTFMDKCLEEIKAFAERELRPYEETRRYIAQWHAKYLFQPRVSPSPTTFPKNSPTRSAQVRTILSDASRILEGLSVTSGVESLLLAVDPNEPADDGFLGGSLIGREFWRGMRGGGDHGARAFKAHCTTHLRNIASTSSVQSFERKLSTPPPKAGPAKSLKNELYESVRTALRLASGVRGAEMKWTNPEKLDMYGMRLVGWPEGIPPQNPSTLKVSQNQLLLGAIRNGSMRFERTQTHTSSSGFARVPGDNIALVDSNDPDEDFSWAYNADARSTSPPRDQPAAVCHVYSKALVADPVQTTNDSQTQSSSRILEPTLAVHAPTHSSHTVDYIWVGNQVDTSLEENWNSSHLERPRKRPRSDRPSVVIEDSKISN